MTPAEIAMLVRRLDQQDEVLGEIKAHVAKTNGRVNKLELWQARLEGARMAFSWVQPLAIGIFSGVAVGVLVAVLT